MKGADTRCINLCYAHHMELHKIGKLTFAEKHRVDYKEEIINCLEKFIQMQEKI